MVYSKEDTLKILKQINQIECIDVKSAYIFLATDALTHARYRVGPDNHGYISDFRYYLGDEPHYAFIPNKNSLLWYFRRPFLKHFSVDIQKLKTQFKEVNVTSSSEISVRLLCYEDAYNIAKHLT